MPEAAKTSITARVLRDRDTWTWLSGLVVVVLVLAGIGDKIVDAYGGLMDSDRMTRATSALSGADSRSIPVTLIAIDDETRARWRDPVITHHAAIAGLIDIASRNGATSILVDIDLSTESPSQQAEPKLYNLIAYFKDDGPLLMLVRSIRFRGERDARGRQRYVADSTRPTPYDDMIAKTGKALWVNAVSQFEGDRVARKVQLWQSVCDGMNGIAYASPVLYVAAKASGVPGRLSSIKAFLANRAAADCGGKAADPQDWPSRRNPSVAVQYIVGADTPDVSASTVMRGGEEVPVFRIIPAWTLLNVFKDDVSEAGTIDASPFRGRAVVIGVTHADSRDVNSTPLGSQPGVLILANSIIMAPALADMPELPPYAELAIIAAMFIIFAFIGVKFHIVIATLIIAVLSIAALMVMSRLFGFDAALRIAAVAVTLVLLHRIADALAGIVFDWKRGLGWRALLRSKPEFRKP